MCGRFDSRRYFSGISALSFILLLTSRRTSPFDLGQWRSQGVEPSRLTFIGIKAAIASQPTVVRAGFVSPKKKA